jgi:hypothetical protein
VLRVPIQVLEKRRGLKKEKVLEKKKGRERKGLKKERD